MSTSPFDSYASDYDTHFTHSAIGILQRKRVYAHLVTLLNKQIKMLEINCGTGHDALIFAPNVEHIFATDISRKMISEANRKKEKTDIKNLDFSAIDTNTLHKNLSSKYELLFSNFGGLNCLAPNYLKAFSRNIAPFIAEKGKLALVIMGKKCLWENFFFLKRKDPRFKRRNVSVGIATTVGGDSFNTYYYSPTDVQGFFADHFHVNLVRPIGLFIPPSYLNSYFKNKNWLLRFLNVLEKITGNFAFTSNYADHYLIILEKNKQT